VTVQTLQAWGLEIPAVENKNKEEKIVALKKWLHGLASLLEDKTGGEIPYNSQVTLPTLQDIAARFGINYHQLNAAMQDFDNAQNRDSKGVFKAAPRKGLQFKTREANSLKRAFEDAVRNVTPIAIYLHGQEVQTIRTQERDMATLLQRHPYTEPPGDATAAQRWLERVFSHLNENFSTKIDAYVLPDTTDIARALGVSPAVINDILSNPKFGQKVQVTQVGNRRRTVYVPANPYVNTPPRTDQMRRLKTSDVWQPTQAQTNRLQQARANNHTNRTTEIISRVILNNLAALAILNQEAEYALPSVPQLTSAIFDGSKSKTNQALVSQALGQINNTIPHPLSGEGVLSQQGETWIFRPANAVPRHQWQHNIKVD
jgi:hypothetical protein